MVGEAMAYVQDESLKVIAIDSVRFTNSPTARDFSLVVVFLTNGSYKKMANYSFWSDFFDTYQSLSDFMKILWIVVSPLFILGLVAMVLFYKNTIRRIERLSENYRDINAGNKK